MVQTARSLGSWRTQGAEGSHPARREQTPPEIRKGNRVGHCPRTPMPGPELMHSRLCNPGQIHTTSLRSPCSPGAVALAQGVGVLRKLLDPTDMLMAGQGISLGTGTAHRSPGPVPTQV